MPSFIFSGAVRLRFLVEPEKFLNLLEKGEGFRFGRTAARPRTAVSTIVSATLIIAAPSTSFTISTALTLLISISISISVAVPVAVAVAVAVAIT